MANSTTTQNKFLITIAGPTAVGKSSLAMELALMYKAEIFSADSRQVYKLMNIGTAKPSSVELKQVRHHFIDHIDIDQPYSVGDFEMEIRAKLNDYFKYHDIAIVVGGTGLYIKALMDGIDKFPDIPADITEKFNSLYTEQGLRSIQEMLYLYDREYYNRVDLNNSRRILRALEVSDFTGKAYSTFLNNGQSGVRKPYEEVNILLSEDRELLYKRINERVDIMIDLGLVSEVMALSPYRSCQSLETVGYKEIFEFLDGSKTMNESVDMIKQNTRRYAKRQITWFRKYGIWEQFESNQRSKILQRVKNLIS